MTEEWNECLMRGCGAWGPYKTERLGLGRFGLWGPWGGSGWGRGTVESVRGGQLDVLVGQKQGCGCSTFFNLVQKLHVSSPPLTSNH
jgi:hypothetical protein